MPHHTPTQVSGRLGLSPGGEAAADTGQPAPTRGVPRLSKAAGSPVWGC